MHCAAITALLRWFSSAHDSRVVPWLHIRTWCITLYFGSIAYNMALEPVERLPEHTTLCALTCHGYFLSSFSLPLRSRGRFYFEGDGAERATKLKEAMVTSNMGITFTYFSIITASNNVAKHFFQIERAALHSYGPDPHSCVVICCFLTGYWYLAWRHFDAIFCVRHDDAKTSYLSASFFAAFSQIGAQIGHGPDLW